MPAPKGNTNASHNKRMRREALREELKSREYLRQIHGLLEKDWPKEKVPEYRAKSDIYFRLLNKTLPDVKSIEHNIGDSYEDWTDEQLMRRLSKLTGIDYGTIEHYVASGPERKVRSGTDSQQEPKKKTH